jgi:hypothetical protein
MNFTKNLTLPGFIARRLCPHLIFVRPHFRRYAAAARVTRRVFALVDVGSATFL